MAIKVVSWDVYGTLISSKLDETRDDEREGEPRVKAREGALETLTEIKRRGIIQVTSSDGDLGNLRDNLAEAGIDRGFFADLYKMDWGLPKDYSFIIKDFGLSPRELLVVGNNYEIDVEPALKQGCLAIWTPKSESLGHESYAGRILEQIDEENAKG